MTEFTRRAGRRGVLDSTLSLAADLLAMIRHPFGVHDYIDLVDWTESERLDHQELVAPQVIGTVRTVCWLCEARETST